MMNLRKSERDRLEKDLEDVQIRLNEKTNQYQVNSMLLCLVSFIFSNIHRPI